MGKASRPASNVVLGQCVAALDHLYSRIHHRDHITLLSIIEEKLFHGQYKDFENFRAELFCINDLPLDTLEASINAAAALNLNEELYRLPIFSSTTYTDGSTMYYVHDTSPPPVNNWLPNNVVSLNNKTNATIAATTTSTTTNAIKTNMLPLYCLFVRGNGNQLEGARDKVDAALVILTDATISPIGSNTSFASICANVTIVHPLGPLHTSNLPGYEHWIKVGIIKKSRFMHIRPADVTKALFESHVGSVQILYDAGKEVIDKEGSGIRYQFALSVMNNAKSDLFNMVPSNPRQEFANSTTALIHVSNRARNFELIDNENTLQYEKGTDTHIRYTYTSNIVQCYSDYTQDDTLEQHWKLLEQYAVQNDCSIVHKKDYQHILNKAAADGESNSKHIYFTGSQVIHIFHKSTKPQQRILETVCMLKVNRKQHIGDIHQIVKDDNSSKLIGFTMSKYDMTLKSYLQQQSHLTSFQRMDLILQMAKSVKTLHEQGVAHRDLSLSSFMVTFTTNTLLDGLPQVHLYLANLASAVLFNPQDTKTWWLNKSVPTADLLTVWCKNLPYIVARPDHTHLLTQSIQTLPKTSTDHALLPHLIHAPAEDVYSLGTLMRHIFSGMQAWPGLAHMGLDKLRETVWSDAHIGRMIDMRTHGPVSSKLLKKILHVEPEDRLSANQVLEYIKNPLVRDVLLLEWNSSILYTETMSQPILQETIKHAAERAGASGDMDAEVNSIQAEEAVAPSEPSKKTKKYYIPTGRPVGRPRKKVRPKPPGRPKGSKNKVYYYVTEEEEKARLEVEKAEREQAETANQAASDTNNKTHVQAASGIDNTLTSINANAVTQLKPSSNTPSVFDMDALPTIATDTLTEADIQEILSNVVGSG